MMKIGSILLGTSLILVLLIWPKKEVVLVTYNQGRFFVHTNAFELGWIHSVEKEPWFEKYEIIDGKLLLKETYFKTFGAGTPSTGQVIPSTDGYIHMAINKQVPSIQMIVSDNVEVTFYSEEQFIKLYELVDDYTNVTLEVKKIPWWRFIEVKKDDK